jgi:hypothetical protein
MNGDKKKEQPVAKIRSVLRVGKSLYIALPREFIALHGIQKGDRLPALADHIMKVVPMKEE